MIQFFLEGMKESAKAMEVGQAKAAPDRHELEEGVGKDLQIQLKEKEDKKDQLQLATHGEGSRNLARTALRGRSACGHQPADVTDGIGVILRFTEPQNNHLSRQLTLSAPAYLSFGVWAPDTLLIRTVPRPAAGLEG